MDRGSETQLQVIWKFKYFLIYYDLANTNKLEISLIFDDMFHVKHFTLGPKMSGIHGAVLVVIHNFK